MDARKVLVERIIIETPDAVIALAVREWFAKGGAATSCFSDYNKDLREVDVPAVATRQGVSPEFYHGYRRGLMSACADVVCVRDTNGRLEVPLISRAKPPFNGGWWVQGGVIYNFRSIRQFLFWKLFRESRNFHGSIDEFVRKYHLADDSLLCGGARLIGFPLGVYRTSAEDSLPGKVADTMNLAYLALWPAELPFGHDKDHTALRWVTLSELFADKNLCGHWYPQRLAFRALQIVAAANGILPA